jgi:CheY-like chemotaxis protein
MGIPPEMLAEVFEMFTQVDRSLERSEGGLGVGLAIVKRLVELHGGRVAAQSEGVGRGSEFTIRLPIAPPAAPEQSAGEPSVGEQSAEEQLAKDEIGRTGQVGQTARRSLRILVVDDNVSAAGSLAIMLRLMGHEAQTAQDGPEGVAAASQFRPEVILLDIGMPRVNGFEVARSIREKPWGRSVRLVALTGWGQDEDRQRSEEAGFDAHIVKPVEPAALERLLADLAADRT